MKTLGYGIKQGFKNIVQNINIDIILDKQKEALKPLRDLFIKDN